MRSAFLLLILVIAVNVSNNLAAETCPVQNCMVANHCDTPWAGAECENSEHICCSIVKREHRTACRHHGGECMNSCNANLQRTVSDCPADKVCCVLV